MRTTVTIDDETVAGAKEITGIEQNSKLVHRALHYIVAYEEGVRHAEKTGDYLDVRRIVRRLYDNEEGE